MLLVRRHEISRLDAFSDAAFAFALTLLVVSFDVPKGYAERMDRSASALVRASVLAGLAIAAGTKSTVTVTGPRR